MRFLGLVSLVVLLAVTTAPAQMLEDFEAGNTFSAGTVVADPEDAGNNCLYFVATVVGTLDLATPLTAGESISIRVYDMGKSAADEVERDLDGNPIQPLVYVLDGQGNHIPAQSSAYAGTVWGWNVGVSGTYNWGIALMQKAYTDANNGYNWPSTWYDAWAQTGNNNHSPGWFGGRQYDALSVIGSGTIHDPEIPGDGKWITMIFTLNADGSVTAAIDGVLTQTGPVSLETAITQVYVGNYASGLGEVYIDDVTRIGAAVCNPGDADNDGDVDLDDFVILKNNFGTTTGADCSMGDFDGDGDVDLDDFVLLKNNFGT